MKEMDSSDLIDLRLPNGETQEKISPYAASKIFAERYPCDLRTTSQIFMSVSYETPIPFPVSTLDELQTDLQQIVKTVPQGKDGDKDREGLINLSSHYKGEQSEVAVQDMLKAKFKHLDPKVMLAKYKHEWFRRFFKKDDGTNNEYDIILVFGQLRAFVVLEVKNSDKKLPEKRLKDIAAKLNRSVFLYKYLKY